MICSSRVAWYGSDENCVPPKAAQYWLAKPRPPLYPGTLVVAQFWPVSHCATASQIVPPAALASVAVTTPPAMVAAPATPIPANRALRDRRFVAACFAR